MAVKNIIVPDLGDFSDVEIIEILFAVGDRIQAEDSLITVESDKASMEIPASDDGIVKEVKVNLGDRISTGDLLGVIELAEAATAPNTPAASASNEGEKDTVAAPVAESTPAPKAAEVTPTPSNKPAPTANIPINEANFSKAYASPSVRKFARELGVDLGQVAGSGRKSRIVKEDITAFVKQTLQSKQTPAVNANKNGTALGVAPMPEINFSQWGEVETVALSKINKLTGEFLHRNWVTVPHVTQFDEADITEMEAFRKQMGEELKNDGIKITPLAFIMKAVAASLKAFPRFNSSLDNSGQNLIQKHYYHIGVAVDTPDGLVVPVVRDVDQKSLIDISQEIRAFAKKARDKKLKPSDMQGGCFSISSLGGIGGTKFTPIVNAPEVAILGVSKSSMQPVWNGKEFAPRLMLPLSLSYDHRVIDGADGARFITHLNKLLSDIRRLML